MDDPTKSKENIHIDEDLAPSSDEEDFVPTHRSNTPDPLHEFDTSQEDSYDNEIDENDVLNETDDVDNQAGQNSDRIPLVPLDFTSIDEAQQNFMAVFESRYGINHPNFFQMSLQAAVDWAFDPPTQEILDRKPLAIYLHNDNAVAAHILPQTVLCSDAVSNLLQKQYVTWAWDVTHQQNRNKLLEWLSTGNLTAVCDTVKMVPLTKYPILIIVAKERSQITPISILYGQDTVAQVLERLIMGLDTFQSIRMKDVEQERQRMEREQFRQEQADEYDRSLAADKQKKRELEKQQQLAREEERQKQTDDDEKMAHTLQRRIEIEDLRGKWGKLLPSEPEPDEPDVVRARITFPDGVNFERCFRIKDSLELLFTAVFTHSSCPDDVTLISGYPRRPLECTPEWYRRRFGLENATQPIKTFAQEGLTKDFTCLVRNGSA